MVKGASSEIKMAGLRDRRVARACFDVPERLGEDSWAHWPKSSAAGSFNSLADYVKISASSFCCSGALTQNQEIRHLTHPISQARLSGPGPSLDRRLGVPATGSRRRIARRCRQPKTASLIVPLILIRVEKHGEDEQADGQQNYSDHTRPHQSEFTPGLTTLHYTTAFRSVFMSAIRSSRSKWLTCVAYENLFNLQEFFR
jgi:hypothetical protein